MEIVIFLAAVSAASIFVGVEGTIPTPVVRRIYGGRRLEVSIGDAGIDKLEFYANVNKEAKAAGAMHAVFYGPQPGRSWSHWFPVDNVKTGDAINYETEVTHKGKAYPVSGTVYV